MGVYRDATRGTWFSRFQWMNRTHKREGFKTSSLAYQWEGEQRRGLEAPPLPPEIPTVSFQGLATMYLDDCELRMQHNTYRAKRFCYRRFLAHLGEDMAVERITKKGVSDFLQQRAQKDGSTASNRDRKDLASLFHWASRKDLTTIDPTRGLENYPETRSLRYVPPVQDIASVRLVAKGDESDLIETLYYTAARLGEIAHYRPDSGARAIIWDDVNFEQGWIRLWTRKRRGGELEEDRLPMSPSLKSVMERRWKGFRRAHLPQDQETGTCLPYVFEFQSKEIRGILARLCRVAKVKEFTFHAIRHHVLSILNDSGKLSLKQVQLWARHKRQATTENYLRSMRGLEEAVAVLEKSNGSNVEVDRKQG
jgi:integrase